MARELGTLRVIIHARRVQQDTLVVLEISTCARSVPLVGGRTKLDNFSAKLVRRVTTPILLKTHECLIPYAQRAALDCTVSVPAWS